MFYFLVNQNIQNPVLNTLQQVLTPKKSYQWCGVGRGPTLPISYCVTVRHFGSESGTTSSDLIVPAHLSPGL